MTELTISNWRKSTRSSGGGNCVEMGHATPATAVGVRDTKDRDGGTLLFTPDGWASFVGAIKSGDFRQT